MAKMPLGYSPEKLLGMLEGAKRKSRQPGVYNIDRDQVMSFGLSPQSVGKEIVKHHPEMGVQVLGEDLKVVDSGINPEEHSKILQHPQNNISPGVSFYPNPERESGGLIPDRYSRMYKSRSDSSDSIKIGKAGIFNDIVDAFDSTGKVMDAASFARKVEAIALDNYTNNEHPGKNNPGWDVVVALDPSLERDFITITGYKWRERCVDAIQKANGDPSIAETIKKWYKTYMNIVKTVISRR